MRRNYCGICVPHHEHVIYDREESAPECILPHAHTGPHLLKNVRGQFFCWEDDRECDCEEEACDCFVFWEMSSGAASSYFIEKDRT